MQLQIFSFQSPEEKMFNEIRTVEIDGEIWFVGSDVAKSLWYGNTSDAISRHCKIGGIVKRDIPSKSWIQNMTLINEPNVYRLIVKSQLPSAEKFETWLFEEVIPSIRRKWFYWKIDRAELPNFITRYKDNYHKLPNDYFSVISEMFARLHIELEKVWYQIPDKGINWKQLMPDISVWKWFAKFLKENSPEFFDTHKTYLHTFPDWREFEANMYHIDVLPTFIKYVNKEWIPQNAVNYFKIRDPLALDYLPKLISIKSNKS